MARITVNGRLHDVDVDPDTPLLWVLRDTLGMGGTKYGCGIAAMRRLHGACRRRRRCAPARCRSAPSRARRSPPSKGWRANGVLHRVQQAWIDHDVPQCGYCQSGMIMAVAALLKQTPNPTDAEIDAAITNICRCGTYQRVRAAIHSAANA